MRTLVIILALLAAGKIATVEYLHRAASDDVIVAAYAPRALEACGRDARHKALGVDATAWKADIPMRLEIGQRGGRVALWQVDNPAWARQFRHPYLVLSAGVAGGEVACAFDVLSGTAVTRKI